MRFAKHSLIIIFYFFAAVAWTWPLAGELGNAIPGGDPDAYVHIWNVDWLLHSLEMGHSPFFTNMIFYPHGASMYSHNFPWLNALVWLPLQLFMSAGSAYTIMYLLVYAFNGWATFVFAKCYFRNQWVALFVGLVVTGWPYLLTRYHQPNLILIGFVPLAMFSIYHLITTQKWRYALLLGLLIALIGYGRLQMLVLSVWLLGFYTLWLMSKKRSVPWKQLVLAMAIGGSLLMVVVVPMVRYQLSRDFPQDMVFGTTVAESDLLSYVYPNPQHPFWGKWSAMQTNLRLQDIYGVGLAIAIMCTIGTVVAWRRGQYAWIIIMFVYFVLANGNYLTINDQPIISLPHQWMGDWLLSDFIRDPDRYNALLCLPVALLVGYGLEVVMRYAGRRYAPFLLCGWLCLLAVEYRTEPKMLTLDVPEWTQNLANDPEMFGLFEMPFSRTLSEHYMYFQTYHGKPVVAGHISRPPREAFTFIEETPILNYVSNQPLLTSHTPPPTDLVAAEQFELLAAANIRYLVFHKLLMPHHIIAQWKQWVGLTPTHEDGQLVVYDTRKTTVEPFAEINDLFVLNSASYFPFHMTNIRTIDIQMTVTVGETSNAGPICITLFQNEKRTTEPSCHLPTWHPSAIPQTITTTFHVPEDVPIGDHELTVGGRFGEPITIGLINVVDGAKKQLPIPTSPYPYLFADSIELLTVGKGSIGADQAYYLPLTWKLKKETGIAWKFFVHLVDDDGIVQAQTDYMPLDWGYPTNLWESGEVINDMARIILNNISSGDYHIRLGLYAAQPAMIQSTSDTLSNDQFVIVREIAIP